MKYTKRFRTPGPRLSTRNTREQLSPLPQRYTPRRPHALRALGQVVLSYPASVKTGIVAGVGDRRDEDIIEFAEEAARIFDRIIIRHDKDLRGRHPEDINRLLLQGIHNVDPRKPVSFIPDESEAVDHAINHAIAHSLIVFLSDKVEEVSGRLNYYLKLDQEQVAV